jgi:hypothetical protein
MTSRGLEHYYKFLARWAILAWITVSRNKISPIRLMMTAIRREFLSALASSKACA